MTCTITQATEPHRSARVLARFEVGTGMLLYESLLCLCWWCRHYIFVTIVEVCVGLSLLSANKRDRMESSTLRIVQNRLNSRSISRGKYWGGG